MINIITDCCTKQHNHTHCRLTVQARLSCEHSAKNWPKNSWKASLRKHVHLTIVTTVQQNYPSCDCLSKTVSSADLVSSQASAKIKPCVLLIINGKRFEIYNPKSAIKPSTSTPDKPSMRTSKAATFQSALLFSLYYHLCHHLGTVIWEMAFWVRCKPPMQVY